VVVVVDARMSWAQWRESLRNMHKELLAVPIRSFLRGIGPLSFRHCAICSRQLYPWPLKREGEIGTHLNYYTYWPDRFSFDLPTHRCACCRVAGEHLGYYLNRFRFH
jgi:hypothetical protein